MTWINQPKNLSKEDIGFVYKIHDRENDKLYFGIKKFWKKIKRKPLKGKKRKRIEFVESDWKDYNSSNKELQELIENNPERFVKEIVKLCDSVTEMKAYEAHYQLCYYVAGDWDKLYNEVINLRLRIRKSVDTDL